MADIDKKPGFKVSEGDWTCEEQGCGNINYARRMECNRCKAPKPVSKSKVKLGGVQIGKALAEKSKGLFSADDWQCATCGNVNWARRSDCNICHAPKFGKVEERTGAGGGFNERENVEYKDNIESDGEYDDFGRLKKKKKKKEEEDNDGLKEEEESGDENDMSRYALDSGESSSDSDSSSESDENKKNSSSRSRSRSPQKSKSQSKKKKSRRKGSRSSSCDKSRSKRSRSGSRKRNKRSNSRSRNRKSRSRSRNKRSRSRSTSKRSNSRNRKRSSRSRSHDSKRRRSRDRRRRRSSS